MEVKNEKNFDMIFDELKNYKSSQNIEVKPLSKKLKVNEETLKSLSNIRDRQKSISGKYSMRDIKKEANTMRFLSNIREKTYNSSLINTNKDGSFANFIGGRSPRRDTRNFAPPKV